MKELQPALLSVFLMVVALGGCAANSSSGGSSTPGSTSTSFTRPSGLQVAADSSLGVAHGLIIGRFNDDDYNDIVMLTSSGAYLYLNQLGSSWVRSAVAGTESLNIEAGDKGDIDVGDEGNSNADSSGVDDLILSQQNSNVHLLQNDGSGNFTVRSSYPSIEDVSGLAYATKAAASAGTKGFAFVGLNSSTHYALRQSDLLWDPSPFDVTLAQPLAGAANVRVGRGDFNQDSVTDFLLVPTVGNLNLLAIKNTTDTSLSLGATITRSLTDGISGFAIADINSDSRPDILLATTAGLELLLATDSFVWESSDLVNPTNFSTIGNSVAVADFTGDGNADIYLGRSAGSGELYSQTGSLIFQDITSAAFGSSSQGSTSFRVYAADLNNDSEMDIIELSSAGRINVHINSR